LAIFWGGFFVFKKKKIFSFHISFLFDPFNIL
jgi:hypothetical protein